LKDIEHQMLHFLENHDEQRIASPDFAGNAENGKPAMLVSTTISSSPTMIYFGQEVGEPGNELAGFGAPTRTSIFDYIGVPNHQKWMNNKLFDGGQLSENQKELRDFYKRLLNFTLESEALMGDYEEIHRYNRIETIGYNHKVFSFVRWSAKEHLIIITNFDSENAYSFDLKIPESIVNKWELKSGTHILKEQLYETKPAELQIGENVGKINLTLEPLATYIFKIAE